MKAAVKAAVKEQLDAEVKAGRFTQAQADEMLERLTVHLDDFGGIRIGVHRHGPGGDWDHHGPPVPPDMP